MAGETFQPRKPDWDVSVLDKGSQRKGNAGCAWNQPDGTIRIKLNSFVVLDTNVADYVITLFKKQPLVPLSPAPKGKKMPDERVPNNEPEVDF